MDRIDRYLTQVKTNAQDELAYFWDLEPHHFSTAELLRLLGQWEMKFKIFKQTQKFVLLIPTTAPVWLLASFTFGAFGWTRLASFFLVMFPLSFIIFFAGLYYIFITFRGKGHLEEVGERITCELQKRQSESKVSH